MTKKAAFLDLASIHPPDLDLSPLRDLPCSWQWFDNLDADAVADVLSLQEIVVVNKVRLDRQRFALAERLRLVCVAATGVDNIDLDAARERGVTVCNARGYATASVVQHVFAVLLALTTKHARYQQAVYDGRWSRSEFFCLFDYPLRELQGLALGIVGYGELGRAVAGVARAFGMNVLLARRDENDRRAGRLALEDLLPRVDVLSLHCPLTPATRGLIGEAELSLMKTDAVLINTARGGLVDEPALLQALQNERLGGAALDVLAQEPPPADYFLLQHALPNLIITPHVAWASRQSRQRLLAETGRNISAYLRGEARNVVT